MKKVIFIHPPPENRPSGGHGFNRRIIAEARRQAFPLEAWPCPPDDEVTASVRCEPDTLVLWDSLFIEALARRPLADTDTVHGLLVHYLPFLNPLLSDEDRCLWKKRFDQAVAGMAFLLATGLETARLLERRYSDKTVFLCEPGVDPVFMMARQQVSGKTADAVPNRNIRIVTVANLLPAKGYNEMLDALADLESIAWEWHIVGDEHPEPAYARAFWTRADAAGLRSRIVRHGILDASQLARLLGRMDLFALASHFETYGMALAEAAAAGIPSVTTAVGEAARLVRHEETGLVVPTDDPKRLREALARLLSDAGLRRRLRLRLLGETARGWEAAFGDFARCVAAVADKEMDLTVESASLAQRWPGLPKDS